jgi:hypothetical protein
VTALTLGSAGRQRTAANSSAILEALNTFLESGELYRALQKEDIKPNLINGEDFGAITPSVRRFPNQGSRGIRIRQITYTESLVKTISNWKNASVAGLNAGVYNLRVACGALV